MTRSMRDEKTLGSSPSTSSIHTLQPKVVKGDSSELRFNKSPRNVGERRAASMCAIPAGFSRRLSRSGPATEQAWPLSLVTLTRMVCDVIPAWRMAQAKYRWIVTMNPTCLLGHLCHDRVG